MGSDKCSLCNHHHTIETQKSVLGKGVDQPERTCYCGINKQEREDSWVFCSLPFMNTLPRWQGHVVFDCVTLALGWIRWFTLLPRTHNSCFILPILLSIPQLASWDSSVLCSDSGPVFSPKEEAGVHRGPHSREGWLASRWPDADLGLLSDLHYGMQRMLTNYFRRQAWSLWRVWTFYK